MKAKLKKKIIKNTKNDKCKISLMKEISVPQRGII